MQQAYVDFLYYAFFTIYIVYLLTYLLTCEFYIVSKTNVNFFQPQCKLCKY